MDGTQQALALLRDAARGTDAVDVKVRAISQHLVDDLNALYPDRSPDPEDSDREVWMKAGERRVVRFLISQLNLQTGVPS